MWEIWNNNKIKNKKASVSIFISDKKRIWGEGINRTKRIISYL